MGVATRLSHDPVRAQKKGGCGSSTSTATLSPGTRLEDDAIVLSKFREMNDVDGPWCRTQ